MKKYVKPELFYEHFELSKHIADCAWEIISANEESCIAVADPNHLAGTGLDNLFMNSGIGCKTIPTIAGGDYEDYCYQPGNGAATVFAS